MGPSACAPWLGALLVILPAAASGACDATALLQADVTVSKADLDTAKADLDLDADRKRRADLDADRKSESAEAAYLNAGTEAEADADLDTDRKRRADRKSSKSRRARHRVRKSPVSTGHEDVYPGQLSYLDVERLPDTIMAASRINATLPNLSEAEDPAELSFKDLTHLPEQLVTASMEPNFMASVAEASEDLPKLAQAYIKESRKLVSGLDTKAKSLSDKELAALLASVFKEHLELMTTHRAQASRLGKSIRGNVSHGLAKALNPWLDGMTENVAIEGVHRAAVRLSAADGCEALEPLMEAYALQHSRIKELLDATARGWYPQIKNWGDWRTPYDSTAVPGFGLQLAKQFGLDNRTEDHSAALLSNVVNLCYKEMIALVQVSHEVMVASTPLLKRLDCTWKSGAGRGRPAALAAALLLALGTAPFLG
jgi:hypothetical protein